MDPTRDLRALLETSERLWNDGDREGFLSLWRAAVPGDYTLESPVGSVPRRGWDACRRAVWDDFQATTRLHTREMIVCGNEVASVVDNVVTTREGAVTAVSVDLYHFTEDGSCLERNFFELRLG